MIIMARSEKSSHRVAFEVKGPIRFPFRGKDTKRENEYFGKSRGGIKGSVAIITPFLIYDTIRPTVRSLYPVRGRETVGTLRFPSPAFTRYDRLPLGE